MEESNKNKIEIKTVEYKKPLPEQPCKVFDLGNGIIEIEVPQIRNKPYKNPWRKHSKNEMVNIEDGEIKETNQSINRVETNSSRFKKQKKYLNRLLLKNFNGADNEKKILLMFEEDISDLNKSYKAVKNFRGKLERIINEKLNFVIVTLFQSETKLSYELWIKVPNISKLELTTEMLQKIWREWKSILF